MEAALSGPTCSMNGKPKGEPLHSGGALADFQPTIPITLRLVHRKESFTPEAI
jgi:hypothetical protein